MIASKEVIFAVPGSKVYISKYYSNTPNSFLNISLTGKKCQLMCSHCKALLLSDMIDINSADFGFLNGLKPDNNRLTEIILRHQYKGAGAAVSAGNGVVITSTAGDASATRKSNDDFVTSAGTANGWSNGDIFTSPCSAVIKPKSGRLAGGKDKVSEIQSSKASVNGVLISGGFDKCGRLPLDERILPEIKEVKSRYGQKIKIFMHLGFTDRQTAESLYECSIDGVLVNIFSDKQSIEEIYNLKGCGPEMFYKNIRLLKDAGLRVSPHLIIGLGDGSLSGEYRSVKEIAESGVDSCVFAIVKNLSKNHSLGLPEARPLDVIKLFEYAKSIMPSYTPVIIGCARPHGKEYEAMEVELLKLGVNVIAFPSEKTLDYAKNHNYSFHFEEQCCAFLAN